ncbi:MAG: hypothetical protein FIB08_15020 [Candidatus Methanoperedens sp.]|nr:hypothetical protein [Candidatus Methanoperedens sp.]
MVLNSIHKLAFALFGEYVRNKGERYSTMRTAIRQAHLAVPWDIYASMACLWAAVSAILTAVLVYLLTPLWGLLYIHYLNVVSRIGSTGLGSYGKTVFILIIGLLFSLLLGVIVYYGILSYPGLVTQTRKNKIDLTLPHAVAYMHALSKGGLSLISIFKSLKDHIDVYGEAAEEIGYIVMETELYGNDMITALKNGAVRTQSDKFRDFLENLINVAATSGDLETFFGSMTVNYQNSSESDQGMYLELLGMFAETYITLFVAGPLFLITILVVMGMMGPGSIMIIKLLIYVIIPLTAIAFSVLLSMMAFGRDIEMVNVYSVSRNMQHYDDTRIVAMEGDDRLVRRLQRSLYWKNIIENWKNPLKLFFAQPFKIFYITVPLAIIYFFISVYQREITVDMLDDPFIISLFILAVPFLFFYEALTKRIKAIEASIPEFLKRLAVVNEVGMPLAEALRSISKINIGVLSTEVKIMYKDLAWSNSINNALMKFEHRVGTVSISRIVTLITKASETSGNIRETLRVAATDAVLAENLRRQKFTVLFSYLVVVYISFAVFLLVLYVFATMFLPQIPETGSAVGILSMSTHKEEYTRLFMHATVIQGFFSGIIVGQMTGESVYDGLKHSVIMMGIAYLFFVLFV